MNVECIVTSSVHLKLYFCHLCCMFLCSSDLFHPIDFGLDAFDPICVSKASLPLLADAIEQPVLAADLGQVSRLRRPNAVQK